MRQNRQKERLKAEQMLQRDNGEDTKVARAVAKFSDYCDEIESVFEESSRISSVEKGLHGDIRYILNGEAASALRRLIPLDVRKQAGIFFTSTEIAEKVAKRLSPLLKNKVDIFDPACGAGNLLISCCQYLPCGKSFDDTIRIWSELIKGCDLFPEFIRAARLRLAIVAANRHAKEKIDLEKIKVESLFKGLKVGDAFSLGVVASKCVVINPPFGYMTAPEDCRWGNGKIQIAGWFMERLLEMASEGQHLVAVLPDVLKSGTRYKRWRDMVCSLVSKISIEPAGRFDADTDIDVFIIHLIASGGKKCSTKWPDILPTNKGLTTKVSDYFEIHVGSVVPHRDPIEGESYPYIHARTAVPWQTLERISERRRSIRRVFSPPFVVVHRTSSPSDKHRCVGSIVNESQEVAVENHLIVLLPKDDSLGSCRRLLDSLMCPETDEWLNRRIRCRHLTVSAVHDLPLHE